MGPLLEVSTEQIPSTRARLPGSQRATGTALAAVRSEASTRCPFQSSASTQPSSMGRHSCRIASKATKSASCLSASRVLSSGTGAGRGSPASLR